MTPAGQTLRLLAKLEQGQSADVEGEQSHSDRSPEVGTTISPGEMLAALDETGFDLHAAIVRLGRDA